MGIMVFCAFRPKEGKADELLQVVRDHLPILRGLGLATERTTLAMRAADGTILEVFEWVSEDAVRAAHQNPEVRKLWARYEACSDVVRVADLPEVSEMFPHFEPVEL